MLGVVWDDYLAFGRWGSIKVLVCLREIRCTCD